MPKLKDCRDCAKRVTAGEGGMYMAKWNFKSCPRCDGDMFIDRDLYGWHEQCLQCGYARELKTIIKSEQRASSEKEKDRRFISSIKA